MSLWSDRDVPPPERPPAAPPQPMPPYSARPARRRRLWTRVVIGALLVAVGFGAVLFGIASAVDTRDRIDSEAVVRGLPGEPLGFLAPEPGDFTVFLVGKFGDSDAQARAVDRTSCLVSFRAGGTQLAGGEQGFALTLGSAASIGHFDAPAGAVALRCDGAGAGEIVVTPGRPGIGRAIVAIIAGVVAILAGIGLLVWGLVGRTARV